MSTCNIVVNQGTTEVVKVLLAEPQAIKKKHPGRVGQGHKLVELNRLRKFGLAPAKTKKITLKSMLDEIKKDTINLVSILITIDETIRILNDCGLEIYLTLKKTSSISHTSGVVFSTTRITISEPEKI